MLAGEGELIPLLKTYARELGIENNAFFIGRCGEIDSLLAVSDVCVLSSKSEGFSNSILEYMAASRPVVATRVGGAAEAIIDCETGFLVASEDEEMMAGRIIELLLDPVKANNFGERGRELIEGKFTINSRLTKTLELYNSLLDRI